MQRWFRRYLESMLRDDWSEIMSPGEEKPPGLPLMQRIYGKQQALAKPGPADLEWSANKKSETGR